MTIESFIADIKSELSSYNSAGLIDDISIYKWVTKALLKFGSNIMTLQDTVINVDNSQGLIPTNFYSLYVAYKCDKKGYYVKDEKHISTLQQSYMWVERVERTNHWNTCDPCCQQEQEKTIIEKFYHKDVEAEFHYHNPVMLKLGRTMKRNSCHAKCRNMIVKDCPYEIIINEQTLFTNFPSGDVYMQYYGLPQDKEGRPMLPSTPKGEVETYLEYHVKRKIFEGLLANGDDKNVAGMFQFYASKEDSQLGLALTETKFSKLTPNSFRRLKKINRTEMQRYELMFPIR